MRPSSPYMFYPSALTGACSTSPSPNPNPNPNPTLHLDPYPYPYPRRVLDCLVGLEDESTEVAESASLAATPHPETPTLNTLTRPYPYNPGGGECEPLLP